MSSQFPPSSPRQLNELQAYDAMVAFITAYWNRGLKSSADIAALLGSMERGVLWANGMPVDPAFWADWNEAVTQVLDRT